MNADQNPRVRALRNALDEEVYGLWISCETAIKVLACIDNAALEIAPASIDSHEITPE